MVTIRGNNVFPTSVEAILREVDEIVEYRITLRTVRSMNELALEIEPTVEFEPANSGPDLTARVASAVKDRLNFHVEVALVPCGQLPRFELKARRFVRES